MAWVSGRCILSLGAASPKRDTGWVPMATITAFATRRGLRSGGPGDECLCELLQLLGRSVAELQGVVPEGHLDAADRMVLVPVLHQPDHRLDHGRRKRDDDRADRDRIGDLGPRRDLAGADQIDPLDVERQELRAQLAGQPGELLTVTI